MKFIEETTALCQECGVDKICKAHIVVKEWEEFLRTFCKQCGETMIKIVDNDTKKSKSAKSMLVKVKGIFEKKIYKNITILWLIVLVISIVIVWSIVLFIMSKI